MFAGEGVGGDPVLTRGKTLWYSKYSICTLFKIIVGATRPKHKVIVGAT